MTATTSPARPRSKEDELQKNATRFTFYPWKRAFIAAIPIAFSIYYLAWVAPSLIPVPAGVKVAFPALTHLFEGVCAWCGTHRAEVIGIGAALLLAGALFRFSASKYYLALAVVVTLGLAVTYYSISAPIDRLMRAVESNLPKDNRIPDAKSR